MISATEALALPTAQLTEDERKAADMLEAEIEVHVRKFMERRGVNFTGTETRNNVIAELNQRFKAAGYLPHFQMLQEQHNLNKAIMKTIGFVLFLPPNDESYRTADRAALS